MVLTRVFLKMKSSGMLRCVDCWNYLLLTYTAQIPVAARSKASGYSCWLAGIVGLNPSGAWIFVYCECCVLPGRGLCVRLITRPEDY
jgi:hypothetical protein